MGCGQLELARILFGKLRPDRGTLVVAGDQKAFRSTADARRAGIAFVPESRRAMLFHQEPVYKNISISILDRISSLFLKPSRERAIADEAGRAIADQAGGRRTRPRHAVRRQPAEGRAGEVAQLPAAPAGVVRADARHGCRRQERRHPHHPRSARARTCHHRAFDRAGDRSVARRSHHRAEARHGGARVRQRDDQQGPAAWKRHEEIDDGVR